MVASCFFANAERISLMVVSLPAGTRCIKAFTSRGAGMTTVPLPHRPLIRAVIFSTRGKPLSSASFSRHDLRFLIEALI
jgi:hypothetical protein